jgi:protein-L-isoaspartate(D-aspartate) O-methyltransferase
MTALQDYRRFFADEITAVANLTNPALIDALVTVPRERFLPPGPWTLHAEIAGARRTPDADPRHVYHNVSVAIDSTRQLFNGNPAFITGVIQALAIEPGNRVLHVGAGLGYYSALLARVVGPAGRVLAIEVDDLLAADARRNLASMTWAEVRTGDATQAFGESFDAILVNAGVTHPQAAWLDALVPGGRMVLPLTAAMPAMGATIGKGIMTMVTRETSGAFAARLVNFVAIYSGVGLRDDALNAQIGRALQTMPYPQLKRLRLDAHEATSACWLHGPACCFTTQ